MSNGPVLDRLRTHWLAACCIFAPLFFGFLALDQAASLLTSSADKIQLPYQFPSMEDVSLSALDLHGRTL